MAIQIIKEPDVHLTADELAQFQGDYQRDYMFYAGTPPTFESYCRRRKNEKRHPPEPFDEGNIPAILEE